MLWRRLEKMTFASRILVALLLTGAVSAQTDESRAKTWQPWITGFSAVTVFLFIVFTSLIIKRAFCERENEEDGTNPDKSGRSKDIEMSGAGADPCVRKTENDDSSSNSSIEERTSASKGHINPTMTENTTTNF